MATQIDVKKHVNLGCAEPPIHNQHIELMKGIAPLEEWSLTDKYVKHPAITNLDATTLEGIPDGYLTTIYASHLLEHIPHPQVEQTLSLWKQKLEPNGKVIINVPNMLWACNMVRKWEAGQTLDGVYNTFEGNNGLQSIFFGTHAHEGERHQSGFTPRSMRELLDRVGFVDCEMTVWYDAHDMEVILAQGTKR